MKNLIIKILAAGSYIAMVVVNGLANSLPINNRSTGDISSAYPNLFAPAGLTFAIWGLIYLWLFGYVLYQFVSFGKKSEQKNEGLLKKVNLLFIATSLANICWIFAWHYDLIGLSVLIVAALIIFLIKINDILRVEKLTSKEKFFVSTPFSLYFGWITVAAIANITVFLVSVGWNGFGIADYIWTSIIISVGALIGILRMRKDKNIAYGLVLIWAYLGILYKHLSARGFDGQYPSVIVTVIICLISFILSIFFTR
ncbi:lantibiotic ABC transporter permease [candidate division WWE3 bacterium CG08_land_8_20_14_0_20_41_15]|uniref:Lantibiotic ABC transporter permease n=1 Tax=candidate division WWE3 bacterium CG08_land_8_20_14_0_20_41_15 TaxID=1975086 RepID=A0A2H0XA40_UNCKA|nr:MAG: lantibiotic ABC transporter permease [candidate division WWE3 bacterium CG08_land_8_20_14_0_20_41_15]